jgi:hypothetical protein
LPSVKLEDLFKKEGKKMESSQSVSIFDKCKPFYSEGRLLYFENVRCLKGHCHNERHLRDLKIKRPKSPIAAVGLLRRKKPKNKYSKEKCDPRKIIFPPQLYHLISSAVSPIDLKQNVLAFCISHFKKEVQEDILFGRQDPNEDLLHRPCQTTLFTLYKGALSDKNQQTLRYLMGAAIAGAVPMLRTPTPATQTTDIEHQQLELQHPSIGQNQHAQNHHQYEDVEIEVVDIDVGRLVESSIAAESASCYNNTTSLSLAAAMKDINFAEFNTFEHQSSSSGQSQGESGSASYYDSSQSELDLLTPVVTFGSYISSHSTEFGKYFPFVMKKRKKYLVLV